MRIAFLTIFLLIFSVSESRPQVFATFSGDTVEICDTSFTWNCILSMRKMFPMITRWQDTLYIMECDTSMAEARCICQFDFTTYLVGLDPGSYTAVVVRHRLNV